MDFISLKFIFVFLPIFLGIYWLIPHNRFRNAFLLLASAIFLAAGQLLYFFLFLTLIVLNYLLGQRIHTASSLNKPSQGWVWSGVAFNLLVLLAFKLLHSYSTLLLPYLPTSLAPLFDHVPYPLGLSYVSFQFISYLLDISFKRQSAETSLFRFALYILFFPKIIVGPITRYSELSTQLDHRVLKLEHIAAGLRRFITGLAKKVLIADQLGRVVNPAFGLPSPEYTTTTAWFVLLAFALQLYFDFSGYVDMAIGLAWSLGFTLPENFDNPYSASSISEFWRRWHSTLSRWFRDYVFFPLERRRSRFAGQQLNTLIVFFFTGLWHGITPPFMLWGLIHGTAVALETSGFGRKLRSLPAWLQHSYALTIILLGWIFFRSPSLPYAYAFAKRLLGLGGVIQPVPFSISQPLPFIEASVLLAFCLGLFFAFPIIPAIQNQILQHSWATSRSVRWVISSLNDVVLLVLFLACMLVVIGAAYKPGIYGGF